MAPPNIFHRASPENYISWILKGRNQAQDRGIFDVAPRSNLDRLRCSALGSPGLGQALQVLGQHRTPQLGIDDTVVQSHNKGGLQSFKLSKHRVLPPKPRRNCGIYHNGVIMPSPLETQAINSEARSGPGQPSRFCHICLRRAERVSLIACSRLKRGQCRKVICEKCFDEYGWNWHASISAEAKWECTHCRKV